jgi:hypothetical protein
MKTNGLGLLTIVVILAHGFAAPPAARAQGCVVIERVEASGGGCKALIRNGCDRPMDVAVSYDVKYLRFVKNAITSAGVEADHHGEPAAGGYFPGGDDAGAEQARLAPGESKWIERGAPAEERVVTRCRVSFTAR